MRARLLAAENRKWWTLAAVSFALFMIMLDNPIVNVALPSIQRDLGIDVAELEWVVVRVCAQLRGPDAHGRQARRHAGPAASSSWSGSQSSRSPRFSAASPGARSC